ncbi:MAG: hypothetical protein AAB446_01970 [Patescibacteria group bacterium]
MTFLDDVHDELAAAMSHTARRLARWMWNRILDVVNAFKSIIIFVPFIFLIGAGWEIRYSTAWLLHGIGWLIIILAAGLIIWALITAFVDTETAPPESRYIWIGSLFATIIAVLFTMLVAYEFNSPILKATQHFPETIKEIYRNGVRSDQSSGVKHTKTSLYKTAYVAWPQIKFSKPSPAWPRDIKLNLWIESVHVSNEATTIYMACKTWGNYDSETLTSGSSDEKYIIDQNGYKYNLMKDYGEYSFFRGERLITGGEVYRWQLTFFPIPVGTTSFKLKHPQFLDHEVTLVWNSK